MSFDDSHAADVQAVAVVHAAGMPGAARNAEASLAGVHRDLPDMVNFSVKYLGESGIDVGASKATSHRLTEALMRETAVLPEGRLSDAEKYSVSNAAMRSVLVQEAAAHELEARTGRPDPMRLFKGDRENDNGIRAMERLEAQKVSTVALYGQATDAELSQMSVGAFNRTGRAQQERTAKVLDIPLMPAAPDLSVEREVPARRGPLPTRGSVTRHPRGDIRRQQPVFGRRVSPDLAVAGQGI
jgi:hypothetical protein